MLLFDGPKKHNIMGNEFYFRFSMWNKRIQDCWWYDFTINWKFFESRQMFLELFRILTGENAKINEFPWTASLVRKRFFGGYSPYCGGTLVNNLYVVTASHCVDG